MMTFKIALRNIFRHKARSIITLSTIVFGCVALIFVGGFFGDLFFKLRESYIRAQTGHIQIYRRGFNDYGKIDPYSYLIVNSEQIKMLVEAIPGVNAVTARLYFSGLISTGENTISFIGQGVEPQNEICHRLDVVQNLREYSKRVDAGLPVINDGEALAKGDGSQIILGQGLAQTMDTNVGSVVTLLTNTVNGSINAIDVNVKGIFFTSAKEYDDIFLRAPIQTVQKLLNTSSIGSLIVFLNKTSDTQRISESLRETFSLNNLDLEIKRWEELADFYNKTVKMFDKFYLVMRLVTGVVVVFGIFNTLNMSVMERISEIGTMMALGVRQQQIMKLFFVEGILLGIVGGILGVIVGAIVVSVVSFIGIWMPPPPGGSIPWISTPQLVPLDLVFTFCLSGFVGGISALYPAFKASRLEVTMALRYR